MIVLYKRIMYVVSPEPVRPMMKYVKSKFNKKITGLEIGTDKGLNAFNMLNTIPNIEKLYLVDPYISYIDGDDKKKTMLTSKKEAQRRLSCFSDRIEFIEKTSVEARKLNIKDLDFIYIDGNHSYDFVKTDIKLWYETLKKDGVIGGDDFCVRFPGVCRAVIEFAISNNLKIKGAGNDWWYEKISC
jgi:predicted O-methyltransferase YrrM